MRLTACIGLLCLATTFACGGEGTTTVTELPLATVSVTPATPTLALGTSLTLSAAAFTSGGAPFTPPHSFTWSTSAANVATVDQTGRVTGVAGGTATISAQSRGVTGSTTVTVAVPVAAAKDTIFTLPTAWLPAFVTITAGQSVVFRFGGGIAHNAIFSKFGVAGSPTDIQPATNQTFSRTFNTRGKFPFECTLHAGMVGEITVQ